MCRTIFNKSIGKKSQLTSYQSHYSSHVEYLFDIKLVPCIQGISSSYLHAILINDSTLCDGTMGTNISFERFLSRHFIGLLFSIGVYSISFSACSSMDYIESFEHINAMII